MKTTNKLGYKVLIFNFISLAIAGGLLGYGFILANNAAIGYGIAIALIPLVTKSIKAGVSVKRVFTGIAIYALVISIILINHSKLFKSYSLPSSSGRVCA